MDTCRYFMERKKSYSNERRLNRNLCCGIVVLISNSTLNDDCRASMKVKLAISNEGEN